MRRAAYVGAAVALVGAGAFTAIAARDDVDHTLPPVDDRGAAPSYRVVYEVVTDDGSVASTEERTVQRPFDSDIVVRDASGSVTSERASRAGLLATRSDGAEWVLIDVPFSPATGDTRLDRFGAVVTEERGTDDIGGRPCSVGRTTFAGQAVAAVDRCVDAAGIVLRETWLDADDEVIQTMTAMELEVGGISVGPMPSGVRLPEADGNGVVRAVDDDEPIPFAEAFALDPGTGWELVGRHLVVPPVLELSTSAVAAPADTAIVSDVWQRGPDLLVLDQGASKSGARPFGDADEIAAFSLPDLGDASLTADDRLAAVNVPLPDGGFLRLSGTVDPEDLRGLAATIVRTGGPR